MAQHAATASAQHDKKVKSRYVPALDGLRAFAVLAVIVYHMGLGWAPGGLMGVTVFFVISGYLINGLLVAERDSTGTISLKSFWLRRIRRLFPAIFLSVAGTAALCTLFDHALLDKMRPDIAPSLLFFNNWWQIFRDMSYFEAQGAPSPLAHFWSLSIEEQFYVVWPLLLLVMYRAGLKKQTMSRVVLVLAALSAIEMALLYVPQGDPSRIYYGTDTRAMSLLLGVWLAFIWPSAAFGADANLDHRDTGAWVGFNIAGIAALAGLFAIVAFTNGYSAFPYYGGIALTTVLSAVLIAVLAVPRTWLSRVFGLAPLVWIGKRSYGMYLWHYPILLLTTDPNSTLGVPWWMRIVQLALIFAVSELSFRFVEDPIRKGKIGEWWRARKDRRNPAGHLSAGAVIPACCFVALLAVACVGVFVVEPSDYAAQYAQTQASAGQSEASASADSSTDGESGGTGKAESGESDGSKTESGETDDSAGMSPEAAERFKSTFMEQHQNGAGEPIYEPLLIGDSVAAGAVDTFYAVFPNGQIDAVVSRNIWESPYPDYLAANQVGEYVVFCLGTNNAVVDWQIDDELLGPVAEDKKVFLVNTRNTREWLEQTNAELAAAAERHPNVTLIDWYSASEGHDEYFAGDGTHLTPEGAEAYIGLIRETIEASLDDNG